KLPITIIRPSVVYGKRDRDMFQYIEMIRKGFHPMIGFGKKELNLVHVDDLVRGIILAGSHPKAEDEIFFLGGDRQHYAYELADTVGKILNRKFRSIRIPHTMVYLAGGISSLMARAT
ncbi:MAG: NAD-dependent epimerase/dehydratase family protein, partial [Aliifodinibius sp.]|nr:NAD-dependent epimerase/dehydratase family protein [Fodinibius sp.]NIV12511.1 NAD-dependent epimerase/dehydratase family protein [Fodinibius sp.]NIY26190.1 NAD-dependent epimerase/dehydratase family protein [Fodinibius sp.]